MSVECKTGDYHSMLVYDIQRKAGRELWIELICTECGAKRKDYLDADEGTWVLPVTYTKSNPG